MQLNKLNDEQLIKYIEYQISNYAQIHQKMIIGKSYYNYEHDIDRKMRVVIGDKGKLRPVHNLPNQRLKDNQYARAVEQKVNYLFSKEPNINCSDENVVKYLNKFMNKSFMRVLNYIAIDTYNCGIAWLYLYTDGKEIKYKKISPEKIVPIWTDDNKEALEAVILFVSKEEFKEQTLITKDYIYLYTKDTIKIYKYNNGHLEYVEDNAYLTKDNKIYSYGKIPFVYFKMPMEQALLNPWAVDGSDFSKRIYKRQDKLINTLRSDLTRNIITGRTNDDIIKHISTTMQVSKVNAGRLVMTETAAINSKAAEKAYKKMRTKKYQILSTLDLKTSDICQDMDSKIFDVKDYSIGVTAPPFHPNCRTTTIPYFDDDLGLEDTRMSRNIKTGKSEKVADMNYKSWYDKYVVDKNVDTGYNGNMENVVDIFNKNGSGAVYYVRNDKYDKYISKEDLRKEIHAYKYYNAIKNRDYKSEVDIIYNNIKNSEYMTDFSKEDVEIAFKHIFIDKHNLDDGYCYFKPDYEMAQSWQRLRDGNNIKKHDLVMLRHERLEYDYMNNYKLNYKQAHEKSDLLYSYVNELKRYLHKGDAKDGNI